MQQPRTIHHVAWSWQQQAWLEHSAYCMVLAATGLSEPYSVLHAGGRQCSPVTAKDSMHVSRWLWYSTRQLSQLSQPVEHAASTCSEGCQVISLQHELNLWRSHSVRFTCLCSRVGYHNIVAARACMILGPATHEHDTVKACYIRTHRHPQGLQIRNHGIANNIIMTAPGVNM